MLRKTSTWLLAGAVLLIFSGCKVKPRTETPEQPVPVVRPAVSIDLSAEDLKIVQHGPAGEAKGQVQIRVAFEKPLIPLTTLSDKERQRILAHFALRPRVEGSFRLLGTSSVVFEPTHSLPMATRYRVMILKGIKDIAGNQLKTDFSWEFKTPPIKIRLNPSPRNYQDHFQLEGEVIITSNIALKIDSLRSRLRFHKTGSRQPVDFELAESDRNPKPEQDVGFRRRAFQYIVRPDDPLEKDTEYQVTIASGVMPFRGNLATTAEYSTKFKTYPPFRFLKVGFSDHCGRKLKTRPRIDFTNFPKWESFQEHVTLHPSTGSWPFSRRCDGRYCVGIDNMKLEPNTTYTLKLPSDLADVYGQDLENPQEVTFTTGDLTPQMWGPRGFNVVTPRVEPELAIKTVNIDTITYRLQPFRPSDILVRENLDNYSTISRLIDTLKTESKEVKIPLNAARVGKKLFDLRPMLSGGEYGAVVFSFKSPPIYCYDGKPIVFNGLVLRTNIGIFTQLLPTGGVVKLNQLTDSLPISGAKVRIYREDHLPRLHKIWDLITGTDIRHSKPCYQGTTNDSGTLELSAKTMASCSKRRIRNKIINELYPPEADPDDILYDRERFGSPEPPRLLIVVEKGNDWTFLHTRARGTPSIWSFGVHADWEAERPISRGIIFSDQQLYRPGDTVKLKGISRYLLFGKLLKGEKLTYPVKLYDPRGKETSVGKVRVSPFGTFNLEVETKKGQPLGTYRVVAETPHKGLTFSGHFRLAEFRVPEFKVKLDVSLKSPRSTKEKVTVLGDSIKLSWRGDYYFGAPMKEAVSSLNITRRKTEFFRPKGFEDFRFGVSGYLDDKKAALTGRYLMESITLSDEGTAEKTVNLTRNDVPFPMSYKFDVEIKDVSNQTSADTGYVTVLPDRRLVGVKLSKWITSEKKPVTAEVIVSSPSGEALPDVSLNVKLVKNSWHSVKTKTANGKFKTESTLVKEVKASKSIKSAAEPVTVTFTPESAGSYAVWAELADRPESGTSAAVSIWVAGSGFTPWEQTGEDRLEIVLDKKEYKVGDEAVAFIKSPFPQAELFFTICREKIFFKKVQSIKGSGYTVRFRITEDMVPNAYVGAALFRRGGPIVPVEEEKGKHIEKIGFAAFSVSKANKYLSTRVSPSKDTLRPSETLKVEIEVKSAAGQGKESELTVIVVDEAVLDLTGYRPPDLVKVVYADRGLSARVNDNRPFVISQQELLQKGTGYSGGEMPSLGTTRIRKEFLKLAYYNPSLKTNASGKASFSFELPDNLTTWRVMAVAVSKDDLFGYGDSTVTVTQPFILRPVLPRFSRLGDSFVSGVAVTNLTAADGKVRVYPKLSREQKVIAFDAGTDNQQKSLEVIRPGESKTVLFAFRTVGAGTTRLRFTAGFEGTFLGKKISESDGIEIPFTAQHLLPTETVVAVGETRTTSMESIKVDDSVRNDIGGLDIRFASTALVNIGEGAKYLVAYPYGCLEQTASRTLVLVELDHLAKKYGFSLQAVKPVRKVIEANVRKLLLMQGEDGGFKFWPTCVRSSCYVSPYVAYVLSLSRNLGYQIPEEATDRLGDYLERVLRSPCIRQWSWRSKAEYRIKVLLGMHYLGRRDQTYFEEYFNRRGELGYGAQISLAFLLHQSKRWKTEARKLLAEIKNNLFITAQTAHFEGSPRELPPSWFFLSSPVINTAAGIKLLNEMEPESTLIAKMARYLQNARKNGRWRNTYENARAIDSMIDISLKRESAPPDYRALLAIGDTELAEHRFKGYSHEPVETSIPMAKLPRGQNQIKIEKKGKGRLYYTLSYAYRLKGPQPARMEGFSIKRHVKLSDDDKELATFDTEPVSGISVKAGEIVKVELEYSVPQTSYHFIIDDPIPAGLEPIDTSLKTTSSRHRMSPSSRALGSIRFVSLEILDVLILPIYESNHFNHRELHDDRVVLFADMVRPGHYRYSYLLRATTSGTFVWPAARASLMYEPEQFGTCAGGSLTVNK